MKLRQGFTLIELMIVMAIIAILAVALAPSIMGAQATARDSARDSAMRSIKMVVQQFESKYKQLPQKAFCLQGEDLATWTGKMNKQMTAGQTDGDAEFFLNQFDGAMAPKDPANDITITTAGISTCNGYVYIPVKRNKSARNNTAYIIVAASETDNNVNYDCSKAAPTSVDLIDKTITAEKVTDAMNKCRYVTGG